MQKMKVVLLVLFMAAVQLTAGCGEQQKTEDTKNEQEDNSKKADSQIAAADEMATPIEVVEDDMIPVEGKDIKDGTYSIKVDSSSSMFKVEECQLTVKEGKMTAVMTMGGTGYLKIFMGTGEEAVAASEDMYIPFVENENGQHTYEVPVEALNKAINCSSFSAKKEKWYDRVLVFRADSLSVDALEEGVITTAEMLNLEDGLYTVEVQLKGGSGKTTVETPTKIRVTDGQLYATVIFGSDNYDYMKVNDEKYELINTEGNSTFEIPVAGFDWSLPVIADTTAMGTAVEMEYSLYFDSSTIRPAGDSSETPKADGTYTPSFRYTGGTGRVNISCNTVTVEEGKATATIIFSSSSYTYVKVDGTTYYNENKGGESTFTIPVNLNSTTNIAAETTAMGDPHEIEYVLYTYIDGTQELDPEAPVIEGLTYEATVELKYAECFQIYRYEGGYSIIKVDDGRDYIIIPEDGSVPEGLSSDCTILQQPLNRIYLQATSSASLFDAIDAVDTIRLSGTKQEDWYVESMAEAMENGELLFAGKYSEPDYEMMIAEGCDLAMESTMILHNPEVQEKLEEMGIPVFIERSSYESHPLAKTEWVKVIGELVGEPEKASEVFDIQDQYVTELEDLENTGKTVAFFYVNQNGIVVTRKSTDYLPKMIELAGGKYVFENLGDPNTVTSGVNMTMEEFYAGAKDADYLIYNAAIDEPLESIEDLLLESQLFADFKAVQEGNVWSTGKSLHQATSTLGSMVQDLNAMLTDENAEKLTYMHRLH